MRKKIVAANWKMNMTQAESERFVQSLLLDLGDITDVEVVIVPPFTAIAKVMEALSAYETVWAIGTGRNATSQQAQEAHAFIRHTLCEISDEATADRIRIQYGGSVKPENARDLMTQPDIDGALVGGASLDPRTFAQIVKAARDEK